jgi:outer membrane receptor protein involved in Fe transport
MKKGGNNYHGELFTTYETSSLNGSPDAQLRYNPNPGTIATGFDNNAQLYQPTKDHYRNLQPGASVGGPILKDRLWFFAAFAPFVSSRARTVDFSPSQLPANAALGSQYFTQDTQTYYSNARLDASLTQKIRVFGSWLYQYARQTGSSLPRGDSAFGQANDSINTPIVAYSHGIGWSAPNATYNVGADITLTPKIVATTRYGYFFENYHDFGWQRNTPNIVWNTNGVGAFDNSQVPAGCQATKASPCTGNPLPASLQLPLGSSTAPYNGSFTLYNANKHYQLNQDVAFFKGGWWGTHNIKVGYQLNHLVNVINQNGNVPEALLDLGNTHSWFPFTSTGNGNCVALSGNWPNGNCAGLYGYLYVQDFSTILPQPASDWNHALYAQDSWTVGRGLTLNLGVRVEKEYLPAPYNLPVQGFRTINFSWTDKVAPRLGAAWDPTGHGKMKLFGSYGVVNDVMKLLLAQTSWGAQSFEQCSYALGPNSSGSFNVSDINLIFVNNRACPNGLPTVGANFAGGTTPQSLIDKNTGISLIENINLRPWEPIAPDVKPYRQHEYVAGWDYQLARDWAFEVRYDRRRLDHILEDSSLNDPFWGETYTVVNPGEGVNRTIDGYASYLTSLGQSFGVPGWAFNGPLDKQFGLSFGTCPTCPPMPKAVRNYDGVELRVTKSFSKGWAGMFSYTWSSLWGNYTGLTNTDQTDGGTPGRNSPDTSRAFDEPFYYYGANGQSNNGPLATDRPNTFKGYAYYTLPWLHMNTTFGLFQAAYQGSPQASYIDIGNMFPNQVSEAVDIFGRDKWVNLTQDAAGKITIGAPYTRRAPWFTQTDFSVSHEIRVKEHQSIGVQMNITNLLGQRAVTSYYGGMNSTYFTTPMYPGGVALSAGAPAYQAFMTGYNPQQFINGVAPFGAGGAGFPQAIESGWYGQPFTFQLPRGIRFMFHYTF